MYLLKLALRPFRLAWPSQTLSAAILGFFLFLSAFLFWFDRTLDPVVSRLEHEQVLTAYLDPNANVDIVDRIRVEAGSSAVVESVSSINFIEKIKSGYPELARELESLGPEMNAIVPKYVSVSGVLDENVTEKIRAMSGVESIESSKERFSQVVGSVKSIQKFLEAMLLGIVLALLVGLVQASRAQTAIQSDAIRLMDLLGVQPTTVWCMRLVSSVTVGLLGGLLAAGLWVGISGHLMAQILQVSDLLRDAFLKIGANPLRLSLEGSLMLILSGGALGLVAGILALSERK